MTGGRPSDYSIELAKEICDKIATSSKGLIRLCKENSHWPDRSTIFKWKIEHQQFSDMYYKAKDDQIDSIYDECLDIADDISNDTIIRVGKNGEETEICNSEYVNRSRLRIDTRKWCAERLRPKMFGAKKEAESDDKTKSLLQTLIDKL